MIECDKAVPSFFMLYFNKNWPTWIKLFEKLQKRYELSALEQKLVRMIVTAEHQLQPKTKNNAEGIFYTLYKNCENVNLYAPQ